MTLTGEWESVRRNFSGDQLRVARELRRMTQAKVAAAVAEADAERAVTAAAISQFEVGDAVPSLETLPVLVQVLQVDPAFLMDMEGDSEIDLPAFFRSLRSTPAKDRKWARNLTQLAHRLAVVLDDEVGLPKRAVPVVPCDPFATEKERRSQAEAAAAAVRKAWELPTGPVDHVVGTLEQHGVVCTRLLSQQERMDAFSVNFSDHPVAVLATDKAKWDRSRFDAAHELGHLVMHEDAAGVPEAEKQAHEFAAAFLMPAGDILQWLPRRADWGALMGLKATWGVSIGALLLRAKTLNVMSPNAYLSAMKMMSARGWRRHEPVEGEPELPTMLHDAMKQAAKRGLKPDQLRQRAAIPSDIFEEVCQLIA